MQTFEPTADFDFSRIHLADPRAVQGGAYVAKISMESAGTRPLYLQLPKCRTKQGIVAPRTRGKYVDLLYGVDTNAPLHDWITELERTCRALVHSKRQAWFQNELNEEEIESMMAPVCRLYKGGKQVSIRVNVASDRPGGVAQCLFYDEAQVRQDATQLTSEQDIIPLVCVDNIRLTSRSFEFDIRLVQAMFLEPEPEPMAVCLIRHKALTATALGCDDPPLDPSDGGISGPVRPPQSQESFSCIPAAAEAPKPSTAEAVEKETPPPSVVETAEEPKPSTAEAAVEETPHYLSDSESDAGSCVGSDAASDIASEALDDPALDTSPHSIHEVVPAVPTDTTEMSLRDPEEVYYDIYRAALDKARRMREEAVNAFLEARNIKTKYMLTDIDDSDQEGEI